MPGAGSAAKEALCRSTDFSAMGGGVQTPHRPAKLGSYKEAARGLVDTVIQVKHDAWLDRRVFLI